MSDEPKAKRMKWDFNVRAWQLNDDQYAVELTTASGKRYARLGYNPMWELIRILGEGTELEKQIRSKTPRAKKKVIE